MNYKVLSDRRVTKCDRVVEQLAAHIQSELSSGERLASQRVLSDKLGISVFTVNQALQALEAKGYVERRHGAGTFITSRHKPITMADTVTLCMRAQGHVWADLTGLLMERLADHGRVGTLLGMETEHASRDELVQRMARSESDTMIVQAGLHFPFEVFDLPGMHNKTVIAAVSWASGLTWPGLYRVLHDHEVGAHLVADHLLARGHRHVLLLMTSSQHWSLQQELPHDDCPALPFCQYWKRQGGTWSIQVSRDSGNPPYEQLDTAAFLAAFDADTPPTAIFGCRDYEAWLAQSILLQKRPDLLSQLDIVGYGNTPWSQAIVPSFTSVDFCLEEIADNAINIVDALQAGKKPQTLTHVAPRLVVR